MIRRTPYSGLPDRQFWKNDPGIAVPQDFDPVCNPPFTIFKTDKVVTPGSCFAQHLAKGLETAGFHHFVTEAAHPMFSPTLAARFNYGAFSARYGNVYTARQFLQLLQRAYGHFTPKAVFWSKDDTGRVVDPFRPQIQPNGFASLEELLADRVQHFAAIRRAVEEADVFVFTLGLTEAWEDSRDGAVFPLAPGVAGGVYDPDLVRFRNFNLAETQSDLIEALQFLRARNPDLRLMLTVSPVPLNATYENRHVFVSTTYSKSVLRCAAEAASQELSACAYFPSYEIITAPQIRGRYYGPDCREVLPVGVRHVMKTFYRHFAPDHSPGAAVRTAKAPDQGQMHREEMNRIVNVLCDEESINNS